LAVAAGNVRTAPLRIVDGEVPEALPNAEKDSVSPLETACAAFATSVTVVPVVDSTVPIRLPLVAS